MKHLLLLTLLFIAVLSSAQDSLIISSHRFSNKELIECRQSKNQLKFLDELISRTKEERPPSKGNLERFYKIQHEKLIIFHIDAGWICRLRGEYNLSHLYLEKSESYLDSLKKYDLYDDELKYVFGAYNNIQKQICYDTYQIDTTVFYEYDCAKFFPELDEPLESKTDSVVETIVYSNSSSTKPVGFYAYDSLNIISKFKSNSSGIAYFNKIKLNLLNELKYRPVPKLFLEMGISQPFKQDTLILKVEINFSPDKFKKEISVAYSTLEDYHNKYYLKQLSEFKYTDIPTEVSFYIPIILRPETPNNYNKMHRVVINDGCFLIEYETPKPIMPDGW